MLVTRSGAGGIRQIMLPPLISLLMSPLLLPAS